MMIVIVDLSRDKCIASLVEALESVPFGEILRLEASSAPDTVIEFRGKRETALVYSFDALTLDPLTGEDCRKLLLPLRKHLPKPECNQHERNSHALQPRHDRRRFLIPSSRNTTFVISQRNSWVFRK